MEACPAVESCTFLDMPAVRAENDRLSMTVVPGWGSRVISLRWKPSDTELLRTPPSMTEYERTPFLYGMPVLFPPNRIENGSFTFEGRPYQFRINEPQHHNHAHGLVHDEAWEVGRCWTKGNRAVIETVFSSRGRPAVMSQFPHEFSILLRMSIDGASFRQTAEIRNKSKHSFPWGLGYHTTFRFPFGNAEGQERCTLRAPVGKRWVLNDRVLPTGELAHDFRSRSLRDGISVSQFPLDDLFLAMPEDRNEAVLTDPAAGLQVTYRADDAFKHWVLHNGDGASGYLCPEPYTCATNAFNLGMDPEITGMQVLGPGRTALLFCTIHVEEL